VLRREPAIDFQSAQEVFEAGTADDVVLSFCLAEERILVSHDVNTMPQHFREFTRQGAQSPGVILVPQSMPLGQAIDELVLIWSASEADEWRNRILWLPV